MNAAWWSAVSHSSFVAFVCVSFACATSRGVAAKVFDAHDREALAPSGGAALVCISFTRAASERTVARVFGAHDSTALVSSVGAALARQQGLAVLQQIQNTLAVGQMPTLSLIEGACVLLCGALLVTPGMVTDAFGVLVMMPFARRPLARWVLNQVQAKMVTATESPFRASRVVIDMESGSHSSSAVLNRAIVVPIRAQRC